MSGFSAAVKIGDLDDFLSPANECIILPPAVDNKPRPGIIKSLEKEKEQIASISLSDCLACSGCVTSAETLLLQSQSVDELVSKCGPGSISQIYITVSSASRRAFAEHFQVPPSRVCDYLYNRLRHILGHDLVVTDVSLSEAIVVAETIREANDTSRVGPVLTSHCPGWTCYATKVLGEKEDNILQLLSRVKSAEQVQGLIIKGLLHPMAVAHRHPILARPSRYHSSHPRRMTTPYHVLVSPCFDKKLEIIRPDYMVGEQNAVDLVLSSTEILDLLNRVDPSKAEVVVIRQPSVDLYTLLGLRDSWASAVNDTQSGGYAHALALEGSDPAADVTWEAGKNADLLQFKSLMRSHGFRNIQNITRRVRSGKLNQVKLVEVMACPGGCPRGGGQPVKPASADSVVKLGWLERVKGWLASTKPEVTPVDANALDTVCQPHQYLPAVRMRERLVTLLGSEEAFIAAIRTEWKSLIQTDAETGEKKPAASDLKW